MKGNVLWKNRCLQTSGASTILGYAHKRVAVWSPLDQYGPTELETVAVWGMPAHILGLRDEAESLMKCFAQKY